MKKLAFIFLFAILMSCQFEQPTQFSESAINSELYSLDNQEYKFKEILNKYKGKTIFIDVWASWCADCVKGFPKAKELQSKYADVVFLFLSVDKNTSNWKKGISRFNLKGEHYIVENDFDAPLSDFLNLNWIPRYVVIDKKGSIKLFKATKATDHNIEKALQNR